MRALPEAGENSRTAARYRICAPVVFSWAGEEHTGEGVTRDISAQGLFIWSLSPPPSETELTCKVFLRNSPALRVDITGLISRIELPEADHHVTGFAVSNQRVSIVTGQRRVAANLETCLRPVPEKRHS